MSIRSRFDQRLQRWLDRRIPVNAEITLNQKRIFIFPSKLGLFFLLVLLIMLLAAINYENSMVFALTFWLGAMFVVSIFHTYKNLSGLSLKRASVKPVFAGDVVDVPVQLFAPRSRYGFEVALPNHHSDQSLPPTFFNLDSGEQQQNLQTVFHQRGVHTVGRFLLQSRYPLGLIRAWSWINLGTEVLVYPKPIPCQPPQQTQSHGEGELNAQQYGMDDFAGTRDYQAGDVLTHVDWKPVARLQSPQTKLYQATADEHIWLDWDSFSTMPNELRLSHLCYLALHYHQQGKPFGLMLPSSKVAVNSGDAHLHHVLETLARY